MSKKKQQLKEKVMKDENFLPIVESTFKDADLNHNGVIEKSELAILLKKIHEELQIPAPSDDDVNEELKKLDKNNDKVISKEEFKELVKTIVLFSIDAME